MVAKQKTKKPKKSNYLGFRLSEPEIIKLEKIAKIENRSRGLIAKHAIKNWINLESFRKTNNMIIITKSMFTRLFLHLNEDSSKELVIDTANLLADITRFNISDSMEVQNFNKYAKNIIKFLTNSGIKWFNTIDFNLINKTLKIKGLHDLDDNFSEFFIKMIEYFLKTYFKFDLDTKLKSVSSNLINLEYEIHLREE